MCKEQIQIKKNINQEKTSEKPSRGGKRTLKILEDLYFRKIHKVKKVKIEKKKQTWTINNPEIFQSQNYNSLFVFGDAKAGKGN